MKIEIRAAQAPRYGIFCGLIILSLVVASSLSAQEASFHLGAGAASDSRFGMPLTLGGGFMAGEIPLTILKTELVAGAWYVSDHESQTVICDKCELSSSWLGFYEGMRIQFSGGQIGAGGLPTIQGAGLSFQQAFPSLESGGMGKTETHLSGMGFIRYDLNPGKPIGLFIEGEAVIKLTGRESQESPLEMVIGKLGIRWPTVVKRQTTK